jgi:HPt (histidine-containing phosphotransfer) domain-containing protein
MFSSEDSEQMVREDANVESPVISGQVRAVRPKAWAQLVGMYLQDLPHQLDSMRLALESNDFKTIKQHSHRIKGTSGTYRLDSIFKIASAIEQLANKGDADGISSALEQISTRIKQEIRLLHSPKSEGTADG